MRAWLTDQLGLKIISLLLGFSLWYAVSGEQGAEFAFSVPIELRNLPEGLEVIAESMQQVEVRLRGSTELMRSLSPQDIAIGVDLADAEPGERALYLAPSDVGVPFGLRVMRVTPASLKLELDRTLERRVEVLPRVLGAPADGFELAGIALTPEFLDIVGPASVLSGIDQVTTEPVSAEGLREPYSHKVQVELEPLVRLAGITNVEVTLDVREERIRRDLGLVTLRALPTAVASRLEPESVRVSLEGPRSVIERLSPKQVMAEIRVDGLPAGRHALVPIVRIANPTEFPGVRVVSVEPQEVHARISQ